MHVKVGDTVFLRDGRILHVTDAVDQEAPEVIKNPDDIFIGTLVTSLYGLTDGPRVVMPMSEVVSIGNRPVL